MDQRYRETLLRSGAVMRGPDAVAIHFGAPEAEFRAARRLCYLADRSIFGRLLGTGPDLLDLLQRLSTNDLQGVAVGEGRPTVLTTPKGRIVERLFVHHLGPAGLLLCCGPGGAARAAEHLSRYTFAEKTGLSDIGDETALLAVGGPLAAEALAAAGLDRPPPFGSVRQQFEGVTIHVIGQDGLSEAGFSVVVPAESAGSLWRSLVLAVGRHDGRAAGEEALEAWRVVEGLPLAGHELTEENNPLEAGLRGAINFEKGCYVGQEVVARLRTYDKVSRRLIGLELQAGAEGARVGTGLFAEGREVGRITSVAPLPGFGRTVGLAYIKHRAVSPGETVRLGGPDAAQSATLIETPIEI